MASRPWLRPTLSLSHEAPCEQGGEPVGSFLNEGRRPFQDAPTFLADSLRRALGSPVVIELRFARRLEPSTLRAAPHTHPGAKSPRPVLPDVLS